MVMTPTERKKTQGMVDNFAEGIKAKARHALEHDADADGCGECIAWRTRPDMLTARAQYEAKLLSDLAKQSKPAAESRKKRL
ncbi:hypothetical protein [Dyella ginsengisoli]|uniref:hypothetical protein n=1 Tax=Dyella ginsengisoli TaxID=363848 RepID=UPI0012FDA9B7|nr:hypothetical protein [Dyella ginsengisoli]